MDSKMIFRAIGADIALILVSIFFIYEGIVTDQLVLSIIGVILILWAVIRLVIFWKTTKEHGE